jgi:hypothetical protein
MFDTQRDIYERSSSGWIAWTYKAPQAADWSYSRLVQLGVVTTNLVSDFARLLVLLC